MEIIFALIAFPLGFITGCATYSAVMAIVQAAAKSKSHDDFVESFRLPKGEP